MKKSLVFCLMLMLWLSCFPLAIVVQIWLLSRKPVR